MRLQESHLIHLAVKTKRARLIYNKGLPSQLQSHFQNVFINVKRIGWKAYTHNNSQRLRALSPVQ